MKNIVYIALFFVTFISCEDVIEVDVPSEPPRLTVDALIRINADEPISTARVKVALTSSFFESVTVAEVDEIRIINTDMVDPLSNSNTLELLQTEPGIYEAQNDTSFFTEGNLQLLIVYEGQTFVAFSKYTPSAPIDELIQGEQTLFTGDETEIIISFTDNAERDDYYLFDFDGREFLVTEDEFYPGQTFRFSYFFDNDLASGEVLTISLLGIDENFYNYMNQLIVQAGGDQGPFQTPAGTVRGNIINITGSDTIDSLDQVQDSTNFALGFFAVVQEYTMSITIN
ncbi:MAG: DUF4249 family protein [Flavobacteriaceae bacterium]